MGNIYVDRKFVTRAHCVCSLALPRTHCVDQTGLRLLEIRFSLLPECRIKVCATVSGPKLLFWKDLHCKKVSIAAFEVVN